MSEAPHALSVRQLLSLTQDLPGELPLRFAPQARSGGIQPVHVYIQNAQLEWFPRLVNLADNKPVSALVLHPCTEGKRLTVQDLQLFLQGCDPARLELPVSYRGYYKGGMIVFYNAGDHELEHREGKPFCLWFRFGNYWTP